MLQHLEILQRATAFAEAQSMPVSQPLDAEQLLQVIDLSLGDAAGTIEELEQAVMDYIKYSPKVGHPEFYKLLYSGQNKDALLGDWVASLSNATMHTYQVGPVATLMELELIKQWNKLVGFKDGEGVMVSGGSQANIVGMMLARHKICPDFKTRGYTATQGKKLIAYVSDQSHYSNQRAVNTLGIGSDNLRSIRSDDYGRLSPSALEQAVQKDIESGHLPFYIGLTAGTTVAGAFDPVKPCHEIAKKYGLWLHIDGAWGAPVLFSDQHKHLLAGSHLADSFAWDAHKLMNVPITAAVVLVQQAGALKHAVAGGGGEYLFHADANAEYNLGERSLQCGRRADALKVWLSWKAIGNQGFADKVDYLQQLRQECVQLIENNTQLEMLVDASYLNVVFRFQNSLLNEEQVASLNIQICKQMRKDGDGYVDYANYKGQIGIRLILANKETNSEHIKRLIKKVSELGSQLSQYTAEA